MKDIIRVRCTCGHLWVDKGEEGIIITTTEGGWAGVVKWDNGVTEHIQLDDIEILPKYSKAINN